VAMDTGVRRDAVAALLLRSLGSWPSGCVTPLIGADSGGGGAMGLSSTHRVSPRRSVLAGNAFARAAVLGWVSAAISPITKASAID
jgi:hypothetical protein